MAESERTARVSIELELLRLKASIADRVVTAEQLSRLSTNLSHITKFPVRFTSPPGVDEARRYALQLVPAFTGWEIDTTGLGLTMVNLDPEVDVDVQANIPGAILVISGPQSSEVNVRVMGLAIQSAGMPVAAIQMAKQTTDEISIHVPEKRPQR